MKYIGLDIGGTKCAATMGEVINGIWQVYEKYQFETAGNTPAQVLELFNGFIQKATNSYEIGGIGISCGGPLDSHKGIILSPPNLPGWDQIEIVRHFQTKWGIPTYLQNDANACAVAEWKYGAGKGCENMVFLTFGTGLGAGIIANSRLYCGSTDMAGELGHIRLLRRGPVGYGKAGSFEGFCSGSGIAQMGVAAVQSARQKGKIPLLYTAAEGDFRNITAKLIGDLADEGDPLCLQIYRKCGRMLGMGLSIVMDILNPEVIVIGGVYMRSEHLLRESAMKVIKREALVYSRKACRLLPAALGESIGDLAALSVACGIDS